jgi:phenylacetate-CoA ligase
VITPGNNRDEILRVVQELGPLFDQVVLLGYPPALKDIIDVGRARGVEWSRYQIKLVMAGEVFSEEWRTLVGERTGALDHCTSSASLYGTADAGILANETPLSICIRRFLAAHPDTARELFGESRLPTLAQYDPFSRYFESDGQSLLFSGDNGVPLIRYNILDTGGIIPYETMLRFLAERGFDPIAALAGSRGIRSLPFVYVFGRSDFTVSYFGANIYPENITVGLEQPEVSAWVTGKFVLEVREAADSNPFLSVVVELAPGIVADDAIQQAIRASIVKHLLRLNSEFANYVPPEYRTPLIRLAPIGDPEYFPVGVKHRYTRR